MEKYSYIYHTWIHHGVTPKTFLVICLDGFHKNCKPNLGTKKPFVPWENRHRENPKTSQPPGVSTWRSACGIVLVKKKLIAPTSPGLSPLTKSFCFGTDLFVFCLAVFCFLTCIDLKIFCFGKTGVFNFIIFKNWYQLTFFLDSQPVSRCCWVRFHYIPVDHKGQYKGMAMNSTCDGLWRDWRMDSGDSLELWRLFSMKETPTPRALGRLAQRFWGVSFGDGSWPCKPLESLRSTISSSLF